MASIAFTLLTLLSFGGGIAAGALLLREAKPDTIRWVWFGVTVAFLLVWLIGLVAELQRSESIDLQRLMHLPVALGQIFTFNYVASHFTISIFMFVPAILGLSIGLAVSRGPLMLLLIPLGLSMIFAISAWTYCLRGWLAAMMTNPRRRRAIIMGITALFILIGQAPNLYFNVVRKFDRSPGGQAADRASRRAEHQRLLHQVVMAQNFIPPLWVATGADALSKQNVFPALAATAALAGMGGLGLRRAYGMTLKFYYGESGKKARAAINTQKPVTSEKPQSRLLELQIPGVPNEAAAVATATFRSFMRAPEVKMAWGTSFIVTLILGATILLRGHSELPPAAKPFVAVGPMAFALMMLLQFLTNQFGFDRDGFRAFVLSPADRKFILLGKNLAILPVVASAGVLLLTFTSVWLRLPLFDVGAALFQLAVLVLLGALVSNLLSILVPYRIQPGSMKPTKLPGLSMLLMVLCHLLFPFALLPVLIPPLAELILRLAGAPPAIPINLLLSIALTLVLMFTYWKVLAPMGRLLHRREIAILGKVTQEVE
jgi:hypothetical protein